MKARFPGLAFRGLLLSGARCGILIASLAVGSIAACDSDAQEVSGAGHALHLFADSGRSSVDIREDTIDGVVYTTSTVVTTSFHVARGTFHPIIEILDSQETRSGLDAVYGRIRLKAEDYSQGRAIPLWTTTIAANDIRFDDDYFTSILQGCCDAVDRYSLLRYSDGRRILDFTSELAQVEIPRSHETRYIGFLSTKAAESDQWEEHRPNSLGILSYVDPLTLRTQRVEVVAAANTRAPDESATELDSIRFICPSADGTGYQGGSILELASQSQSSSQRSFTGFSIELRFLLNGSRRESIVIPVRSDSLDLSGVHPEGFILLPE